MHPTDPFVYGGFVAIAIWSALNSEFPLAAILIVGMAMIYYDREVRAADAGDE